MDDFIEIDDLGVPLFQETPKLPWTIDITPINLHIIHFRLVFSPINHPIWGTPIDENPHANPNYHKSSINP